MNHKTRKLITMKKTLHPGDNIDRQYVSRKGGRALMIALIHQYKDSKTTLKSAKKDKLQQPVTALAREEQQTEKQQKWKEKQ